MSETTTSVPLSLWRRVMSRLFSSHDGKRQYEEVFGYPTGQLSSQDYKDMYDRWGIANRIIRAYPQATWREWPKVCDEYEKDAEDPDDESPFTKAFEELCEQFRIMNYLERADRLSGLGQFSLLFLGTGDKDLTKPLGKGTLLYLVPFAEYSITVSQWATDPKDPRYGQPLVYTLQTGDKSSGVSGIMPSGKSLHVHFSRTVHIAEFLEQNDVCGTPRLRPLVNYLFDLMKVVGSSAECYWLAANRGLALLGTEDSTISDEQIEDMKKQAEAYSHKLQRTIVGTGLTAQVLGSDVPDPKNNVDIIIDLLAGSSGIPKRIMLGNEQGELGSSQDEGNWAGRVDERRTTFADPMIMRPFVQKLIDMGMLTPEGEWYVDWPQASSISEEKKSQIAMNKTSALKNYMGTPGADQVVAPEEVRQWLDLEVVSEFELAEPEELLEVPLDADGNPIPPDPNDPNAPPADPNAPPVPPTGAPKPKPGAPMPPKKGVAA